MSVDIVVLLEFINIDQHQRAVTALRSAAVKFPAVIETGQFVMCCLKGKLITDTAVLFINTVIGGCDVAKLMHAFQRKLFMIGHMLDDVVLGLENQVIPDIQDCAHQCNVDSDE